MEPEGVWTPPKSKSEALTSLEKNLILLTLIFVANGGICFEGFIFGGISEKWPFIAAHVLFITLEIILVVLAKSWFENAVIRWAMFLSAPLYICWSLAQIVYALHS